MDVEYTQLYTQDTLDIVFLFHERFSITLEPIKTFTLKRESTLGEMLTVAIPILNKELPVFLRAHQIKHFIPYRNVSLELKPTQLEVCYHFDRELYNFIYNSMPKYVMMPTGPALWDLEELYRQHGMKRGWYDRACFVPDDDDDSSDSDSDDDSPSENPGEPSDKDSTADFIITVEKLLQEHADFYEKHKAHRQSGEISGKESTERLMEAQNQLKTSLLPFLDRLRDILEVGISKYSQRDIDIANVAVQFIKDYDTQDRSRNSAE